MSHNSIFKLKLSLLTSVIATLILLCMFVLCSTALAAAREAGKVPTSIEADKMEYDANKQTVRFLGKVYVQRPDIEIWADKMTVYLDKSGKKQSTSETAAMDAGQIDRIVAENNVRMKSADKTGACQKATYFAKEDKLVMEGSPVLRDGKQSTLTGHMLVHYPSSNQSQVLRGKITFYPPDSKNDPSGLSPGPRKGK